MKKIIYIIPGNGETCNLSRYRKLAKVLSDKGYKVIPVNPDWYKPLSENVFKVDKNSVVCGFSFGAVLAYLIAKKYPYRKAIFASISPIHKFSFKSLVSDMVPYMSKEKAIKISTDIKKIKISLKSLKIPFITLAGEREKTEAMFLVPKTGHYMSKKYIEYIAKLI